jgi:hypothetical protein
MHLPRFVRYTPPVLSIPALIHDRHRDPILTEDVESCIQLAGICEKTVDEVC